MEEENQSQSTVVEDRGHNVDPAASAYQIPEDEPKPEPKPEPEEPKKPESRLDAIKRAAADVEKNAASKDESPKNEAPKEVKTADDKIPADPKNAAPEKVAASETGEQKTEKPSEGRHVQAPSHFTPRAKELWMNVPNPVKQEIERMMNNNGKDSEDYAAAKTFRDDLAEYDNMAKQSGTTIKAALQNYVTMEQALRSDPSTGFRQLLQNMGLQPQHAITHILSAFNLTPQQLARHIDQNPNEYTAFARQQQARQPAQPAQQQISPEIKALQEQVAKMQSERLVNDVIAPFARDYPEYHANEAGIAKVLESGIIESIHGNGLSPYDKLEVALRMVAPNAVRASTADSVQVPSQRDDPPAVDLRGNKSVKGSPTAGTDPLARRKSNLSRRDAIEAAMSELGIR